MFSPEDNKSHTVQVIQEASEDRSWLGRLALWSFKNLIKDNEQEVRKEAIRTIEPMLKLQSTHPNMTEHLQRDVLPLFVNLSVDSAQPVRAALAQ
eukprot:5856004-Amphidinium_carterae.1